jgi:2-polyprenyl-3-methyl-5-hydroxy-6-metoxy-1,4-benzoquinol methylase
LPDKQDIYDFLINRFKLNESKCILDAGCGVGYGSLKMAQSTQANVLGISISPLEIHQAKQNLIQLGNINCSFDILSFEDIPKNSFDTIICVESLKHAIPIHSSVNSLMDGLRKNGRLIVVDDFYFGNTISQKPEQTLIEDWRLEKLIEINDLPAGNTIDITGYLNTKSILSSRLNLIGLAVLKLFVSESYTDIFRGGVYLDMLYAKMKMKYMVHEIMKEN